MKDRYIHLRTAIESFGARFALVNQSVSPIPVEAPLDQVIEELHNRLKKGMPLHPPREVIKGQQEFAGYEIVISEPMQPGVAPVPALVVSIYTNMADKTALTDQRVIAHGVIGLVIGIWLEGVEAEEKKKAEEAAAKAAAEGSDGKVEKFPTPAEAAPKA